MKKLIVVLLCLLGIVYAEQVTVLAINDMHANIDRLPQLATFVKQERAEHPELLLLSAGDNRTGNPYVDTGDVPGLQMIQLMNKLGFNASAYGNHEFDSGLEALRLCTEAAAFPFVCANVQGKDGEDLPVVPYCFFERHGVRIGVMGLVETSKDGTPDVHPDRVTQLVFEHPFNVVRQYAFLREQCDVLMLLTHIGFGNDVKLAALFPEADAIIGGHTHTRLENGHVEHGVLIVQAERDVKYITRLSFDVEDGKVRSKKAELVSLSGYSADAEMQKAVEDVKNNPYMQRCIAHIQRDIPSRDSLGCLMADAQRAAEKGYGHLPNCASYRLRYQYEHLARIALPEDKPNNNGLKGLLSGVGKSTVEPNMLAVYVLARSGQMVANELNPVIYRVRNLEEQNANVRLMLALCARMLKHPEADALKAEAMALKPTENHYSDQMLPPTETLMLLNSIVEAPNAESTAQALREYVDKADINRYSTWRNAWFTLAVYEYLRLSDAQTKQALVNGQQVSMAQPMEVNTTAEQPQSFQTEGAEVYINGYAEGHTQSAQANSAIDNGLRVTRRYEKLMPDGSWVPTGTFEVGDVVKVHLTVTSTMGKQQGQMRYLAVEDRLPAAFEAVNPALLSQALPPTVDKEAAGDWWYYSHNIDNREFLKDRVRFFSTYFYGHEMKATYVARVLRRGKVTAPAAKAELMYRPEVRGLSVPQQFEVK